MVSTVKQIDQITEQGAEDDFVDELKPGTELLHGQYTIEEFLNSGGFGITYLAKDSLDRRVVIKECFPNTLCRRSYARVGARSRAHQAEFKSVIDLFVQEAKSLAKLDHPNIVGVHQVFEDNDTAYMALDYIEGFDLLETLEDGGERLPPAEINKILRKILGAVDYLHGQNILHRDISPDNILIDKKTSEPLLIDFGAAREEVSKASRVLSALRVVKDGYSPQEFYVNGSKQGPSSDLYALAASFYHLITGDMPTDSQTRLAALASDEDDPYVPLAGRIEGYDEAFLAAIDKALKVLPKDRIQTAKEWMELISGGVSELPTASKSAAVSAKTKEDEPTKSGSKMLLMTTAIILVTAGGGYAVWKGMAPAPTEMAVNKEIGTVTAPTKGTDAETGVETPVVVPVEETAEVAIDTAPAAPVEETAEVATDTAPAAPVEETAEVAIDTAPAAPVEETAEVAIDTAPAAPVEETAEVAIDTAPAAPVEETAEVATDTAPAAPVEETAEVAIDTAPAAPVEETAEVATDPAPAAPVEETAEVATDTAPAAPVEETAEVAIDTAPAAPVEETAEVATDPAPAAPVEETAEVATDTAPAAPVEETAEVDIDTAPAVAEETVVAEQAIEPSNVETVGTLGFLPVASAYLPFSERVGQPGVIASLGDNAPAWAKIGQQITAVNGVPIDSFAQINPTLRNLENLGDLDSVQVVFNIDGTDIQKSATLDVLPGIVLPAGLELQMRETQDGTMQPVAITSQMASNAIKAGDILLTYLDTGEKIGTDLSLEEFLLREINKGNKKLNFIIDRGGKKWIAPIQLTDNN